MPFRSRLGRPSRIVVAVVFLASLVATVAALRVGVPPADAVLTAGAVSGPTALGAPADGGTVAGPTQITRLVVPSPTPAPTATPRPRPTGHPPTPTPTPKAVPTPAPLSELSGYRWPLKGRLTLGFEHSGWGSRLVDGERFHDGIDIATFCGDRIRAAHDGVVLAAGRRFDDYVGWIGDLGAYYRRLDKHHLWGTLPIVVVIDDGNGYRSIYAHFRKVRVRPGQTVKAGELLGWEGDTGRASGCHLHYGLFSPYETERMGLHPSTAKRMKLPRWEIARVNPLLVLPYRKGISPASMKPSS